MSGVRDMKCSVCGAGYGEVHSGGEHREAQRREREGLRPLPGFSHDATPAEIAEGRRIAETNRAVLADLAPRFGGLTVEAVRDALAYIDDHIVEATGGVLARLEDLDHILADARAALAEDERVAFEADWQALAETPDPQALGDADRVSAAMDHALRVNVARALGLPDDAKAETILGRAERLRGMRELEAEIVIEEAIALIDATREFTATWSPDVRAACNVIERRLRALLAARGDVEAAQGNESRRAQEAAERAAKLWQRGAANVRAGYQLAIEEAIGVVDVVRSGTWSWPVEVRAVCDVIESRLGALLTMRGVDESPRCQRCGHPASEHHAEPRVTEGGARLWCYREDNDNVFACACGAFVAVGGAA